MVIGSSGLPSTCTSCSSALPIDVTRSVTCARLPCTSAICGTVVSVPSHEPATAFILSKDFCASDCPNATLDTAINTANTTKQRSFMHPPQRLLRGFTVERPCIGRVAPCVVLNYNTIPVVNIKVGAQVA